MAFGRNKNVDFKPFAEPDVLQAQREHIHRSVDRLGLDPDQIIIVGGAVLNAYGIRPAHDVDIVATAQTVYDIYHNDKKTPSGISVSTHPSRPHVVSVAPPENYRYLGVDIITNYDTTRHGRDSAAYDRKLMQELAAREGKFGKYHISTPEEMLRQYVEKRRGDRRAKEDKARVEAYLRSAQNNTLVRR